MSALDLTPELREWSAALAELPEPEQVSVLPTTVGKSYPTPQIEQDCSIPEPLRLITAAELASIEPEHPAWIIPGYIARGAVTELTARIKVGKTTFLLSAVRAVVDGLPFLGHKTKAAPVVYLSEERGPSFRAALERVGLLESERLHILFRSQTRGLDWGELCERAAAQAVELGAGLFVVDTLSDWAGVRGDAENDAGAALEAMRPLHGAAAAGMAVVSVRHDRKSGGEIGDSARGSSAFGGAADILMSLRRSPGQGHDGRRIIAAVGRFDETPPELVVDYEHGRFTACGDARDVQHKDALRWLRENLPIAREWAVTIPQLVERADGEHSRSTLQRAVSELAETGEISAEKGAAANSPRAVGYWITGVLSEEPI